MNPQTPSQQQQFKFLSNEAQLELTLDQLETELTIDLKSLKTKNTYHSIYTNSTLPQGVKTLLSNVKTLYDYIEVNRANPEKVIISETGQIHLVFLLAFGPQSQIKKEIILEIELKEIGKVEGSNIDQLGDRLRQEMIELNKKNKQERQKIKVIALSVEKTNQKLVCEMEELKLQNIEVKGRLQTVQQKVTALEILLKDLYTKYYVLKEEKENMEKRLEKTKLVAILPSSINDPKFKRQISSIFQDSQQNHEQSYIKKIKELQDQRDQDRRVFQEKFNKQEKQFTQKLNIADINQPQVSKSSISDDKLFNSYLKDSEIQKLKHTVSSTHSSKCSEKNLQRIQEQEKLPAAKSYIQEKKRKVGLTGKCYCGGTLCDDKNCTKCKTLCGPNLGQNCAQCMKTDIEKKGLKKGFLVNGNGQVAWIQNGRFCCGVGLQNGEYNCGMNKKYCQACTSLSQVYEHRYKQVFE